MQKRKLFSFNRVGYLTDTVRPKIKILVCPFFCLNLSLIMTYTSGSCVVEHDEKDVGGIKESEADQKLVEKIGLQ